MPLPKLNGDTPEKILSLIQQLMIPSARSSQDQLEIQARILSLITRLLASVINSSSSNTPRVVLGQEFIVDQPKIVSFTSFGPGIVDYTISPISIDGVMFNMDTIVKGDSSFTITPGSTGTADFIIARAN